MSEAIADAPDLSTRSAAKVAPSSKDIGLVGMAETMRRAAETPKETKPEKIETVEVEKTETGLLGDIKAPKAPEKKGKTTPEDDIKSLKAARDEHKKNWETAQAELEKVKTTFVSPDRLTAAEQRAQQFEAKLEMLDLEHSPKFIRDFVEPKLGLIEQAKELVKDVLGEEGQSIVERAMNLQGKPRREYLDEAFANSSPSALAETAGILAQIDTLDRSKRKVLENWRDERTKMSEAERAEQLREANDTRNEILKAFDASRQDVAARIPGYREIVGNQEHNATVEAKFAKARALLTGEASQKDQATAPYLAVECADALRREAALAEENATLKERLAKFEQNKPGVNGNGDVRSSDNGGKPEGMLAFMRRQTG